MYPDGVLLILSQGSVDAPKNHVGFLLDLDVIWESTEPIARDEALTKAGDLRAREREAFETIITDKARELFDAG
ncbi:MAG: TIGR04255 family protein [Dehalococcoidia bacterium]|nr:TIGR04255 family protein [Dehalococcoidia bacterium]